MNIKNIMNTRYYHTAEEKCRNIFSIDDDDDDNRKTEKNKKMEKEKKKKKMITEGRGDALYVY